jgi:hypothetical protein
MPLPQRHQDFQVLVLQVANFGFGSKLPLRGAIDPRPELGAQPKQITRKLTFALECPKLEVFSPWLMPCQNGKS